MLLLGQPLHPRHGGRIWSGFAIPREEMGARALVLLSRIVDQESPAPRSPDGRMQMCWRSTTKTSIRCSIAPTSTAKPSPWRPPQTTKKEPFVTTRELTTDILVVGAGLGGVAAALAAADRGANVILTEEFAMDRWTVSPPRRCPPMSTPGSRSSAAPGPTAHCGTASGTTTAAPILSPTAARASKDLNPGAGWVLKLVHEPRVALAVLEEMLAPYTGPPGHPTGTPSCTPPGRERDGPA